MFSARLADLALRAAARRLPQIGSVESMRRFSNKRFPQPRAAWVKIAPSNLPLDITFCRKVGHAR